MSEDLEGRILGKYELRERVGRGGMAEVYKAYHAALDRYVAIKVLHPFLGDDPEFKERFEREARNVAQLRHPNIIQVHDFDFDPQHALYYMVMEYVGGITLRARLAQLEARGERFSSTDAIHIVRCIADALAYAHSRGVVHRDIKPANVMIDADGRVVLTDFGIARIISGPHMTASGSMVGTPTYMSPEQGLGQSGDHRSDIYSLGILLYQLVTGTAPFDADTPIAIVLKHVNEPLPRPSSLNPDIPEGLERILYKALAKAPEERYQSVEEMIAHLDDLQAAARMPMPLSRLSASFPISRMGGEEMPLDRYSAGHLGAWPRQPERSRSCLVWLALVLLMLTAAVSGAIVGFSGALPAYLPLIPDLSIELSATPTASISITGEPIGAYTNTNTSPSTGVPGTAQALTAPEGLLEEPLPQPTGPPCAYNYQIVSQTPVNGASYPELTSLTLQLRLRNSGNCAIDDNAQLVFIDGFQLQGPNYYQFDRQIDPGQEIEVELQLHTPAYDARTPTIYSTWAIFTPDGVQIGPDLTLEIRLFPRGE